MPEAMCVNCGEPLAGPYCQACGQRAFDPDRLSVRSLARDLRDDLYALDFKTVRTLRGIARPGFLTEEYLAGRHQPYLTPIKVYLLCAAIFFLLAPLSGLTFDALTREETTGLLERLASARMKARGMDRTLFAERFDFRLQTVYTFGLSISLVAVALLLSMLFRRRRRPFGAHVVFALHYVGFLYFAGLLVGVARRIFAMPPLLNVAFAYVIIGPYLVLALRRVYAEPLPRTLLKAVVLAALTLAIDSAVNLAALLLTMMLV